MNPQRNTTIIHDNDSYLVLPRKVNLLPYAFWSTFSLSLKKDHIFALSSTSVTSSRSSKVSHKPIERNCAGYLSTQASERAVLSFSRLTKGKTRSCLLNTVPNARFPRAIPMAMMRGSWKAGTCQCQCRRKSSQINRGRLDASIDDPRRTRTASCGTPAWKRFLELLSR